MPMTSSTMVPLGTKMPSFSLPDVVSGGTVKSTALDAEKPVLILFICVHCPFTRQLKPAIRDLARTYRDRVGLLAISSNDITQVPEDSPEGLRRLAQELGWSDPFVYDESQEVARALGAACTPECFLYDRSRALVYRGQIEQPLREALEALLSGRPIDANQRPGSGCNIKWRAGARLEGARR